ncbi:MAG: 2-dehydropantoate 2-reductase [Eubacteriales bacterium]|nr:2-dehydropantoate 2-reductase [Eubacteriales bacterium]
MTAKKESIMTGNQTPLKYLIIGAGGTGGSIAASMTEAGKDVTVIARGAQLSAVRENGIAMETTGRGNYTIKPIKAFSMEEYRQSPDIIFVCVKGYSLPETIPFIRRIAHSGTIVIPLLNLYGIGGKLQELLPEILVTDGCIYIAAEIKSPGILLLKGDIFRVVFGVRKPEEFRPVLSQVKQDLDDSGITGILSDHIAWDALRKFSYVSPMAACGQFYDSDAGDAQKPGEIRELFCALMREIESLAAAMGIFFEVDIVQTNLDILHQLDPAASTSMQRDLRQGRESELDGLVFEVVRMGKTLGVSVPNYERIAQNFC